jgi:hypothetical protein
LLSIDFGRLKRKTAERACCCRKDTVHWIIRQNFSRQILVRRIILALAISSPIGEDGDDAARP